MTVTLAGVIIICIIPLAVGSIIGGIYGLLQTKRMKSNGWGKWGANACLGS